jgi:ectoine hydroxylase-related dioxygenase (phytanoyl-CoA dioxygenase family)
LIGLIMPSEDETDVYRSDGYVVPKFQLAESDLDKLQHLALQLVADNPQGRGAIRSPHIAENGSPTVEKQAEWLSISSNPKLLDMIERFIGPDIILWTSTLFYKAPWEGSTPWHRDGCPFLTLAKSDATITAWIAVFDVTRENGALRVIPKSHIYRPTGVPDINDRYTAGPVCLSEAEERTAVDVELKAGQMIIFDVSTVHGSWSNLTSRGRYGYAVRFFPSTSRYNRHSEAALARSRELILVRGQDRAGNICST